MGSGFDKRRSTLGRRRHSLPSLSAFEGKKIAPPPKKEEEEGNTKQKNKQTTQEPKKKNAKQHHQTTKEPREWKSPTPPGPFFQDLKPDNLVLSRPIPADRRCLRVLGLAAWPQLSGSGGCSEELPGAELLLLREHALQAGAWRLRGDWREKGGPLGRVDFVFAFFFSASAVWAWLVAFFGLEPPSPRLPIFFWGGGVLMGGFPLATNQGLPSKTEALLSLRVPFFFPEFWQLSQHAAAS